MIKVGIMTDEEFDMIISKDQLVVIDFSATWCGPCKMMEPVLEDAADKHKGEYLFYQVDVDSAENLATRYQISAVPTIIAFKSGKVVGQTSGYMPLEELEIFLAESNRKTNI